MSKININNTANIPQVRSEVFGTTEKLNMPVFDTVKKRYKSKFNEGTKRIQLAVTVPSKIFETINNAQEIPVETVTCFIIIETRIARAV